METTVQYMSVTYEHLKCWVCGCNFAVDQFLLNNMREQDKVCHCPNGCRLGFGESKASQLEKQLTAERARHDQTRATLGDARRSNIALRGVVTRTKKRVGKGVCPCCNRHFRELERHMADMHPEYAESE